mmetsp:Transcript_47779/g.108415  ORF Transcript_47779/g.108415 Transcript_47779/m.108415 type:complete len:204 (+) Transcript_47779:201-812(+)
MAKTMKSVPPMSPTVFSEMYSERMAPPATAPAVATVCATMAPVATLTGFWAAARAIVERKERSPNSAAKTNTKVCTTSPKAPGAASPLFSDASNSARASSASSSSPPFSSSSMLSASLRVRYPKYANARHATTSSNGTPTGLAPKTDGTTWKTWPSATLMKVITTRAPTAPTKAMLLENLALSNAAMKKVLSPSSDTKMSEKA